MNGVQNNRYTKYVSFFFLLVVTIILMVPVLLMLFTAFKTNAELLVFPPTFVPKEVTLNNFKIIFDELNLIMYYKNSLLIAIVVVSATLISSSFVAFGFSRYRAPGKKILFMLLLGTLMIPYPVTMIPQFLLFRNLGWVDTFLPLMLPAFFGSAYMIFLLKQFLSSLTDALFESARMDGCNEFRSFFCIALPLSGPALATVAIFSFLYSWDDLLAPVIYLNSVEKYTLPIALNYIGRRVKTVQDNITMACSLLTVLPCICVFLFCQRYFVKGIVLTGLK